MGQARPRAVRRDKALNSVSACLIMGRRHMGTHVSSGAIFGVTHDQASENRLLELKS